jgi:Tfp pilus assembly pilus retraction ATPase PilT
MIQTGKKVGMELMDESLMRLLKEGRITGEAAYSNAANKKIFQAHIQKK